MRIIIQTIGILVVLAGIAASRSLPEPIPWWADAERPGEVELVNIPSGREFPTVRIDSMVPYVRYIYHYKQAVIINTDGEYWFFFAYNDNQSHVRTRIFNESQLLEPESWIVEDIAEWIGSGTLRYASPVAWFDGTLWHPEVTWNTSPPTTTSHQTMTDGFPYGSWSSAVDVSGPAYDYYLPLTEVGPDNEIYMDALARDIADDTHVFKAFDGFTGTILDPPGEVIIFPSDTLYGEDPVYGMGYENSQLLCGDGRIIIAAGGYRTADFDGHENPLLIIYRESVDGGNTWSHNVWIDQGIVPDMPGDLPGIATHNWPNFFDGLIEDDGDLHFLCAISDSGYYDNTSHNYGIFDVHQDDGVWMASLVCDGTYQISEDSVFVSSGYWRDCPSLAESEDGTLFAAWADDGSVNPNNGSLSTEVWLSRSHDGGNTWIPPVRITDVPEAEVLCPRLLPVATDSFVYVLTMYDGMNGPMDMIQVPTEFDYVPVELSSFVTAIVGDTVRVEWTTQSEKNNYGFNLHRATDGSGPFSRLNQTLIPGAGTSAMPRKYQYLDGTTIPGNTYWYRLEDISLNGKSTFHGPISVAVPEGDQLRLDVLGIPGRNDVRFSLMFSAKGLGVLHLYDIMGRQMCTLWEGDPEAGSRIDARFGDHPSLAPGCYVAILTQNGMMRSKKVVILPD